MNSKSKTPSWDKITVEELYKLLVEDNNKVFYTMAESDPRRISVNHALTNLVSSINYATDHGLIKKEPWQTVRPGRNG